MKTNALPEVESLRAEVRQLREAVAELEDRLEEFEGEEDENVWGIWPYCWVVAGWEAADHGFHSFHKSLDNWNLRRHNRRTQRQVGNQEFGELRLS